MVPGRKVHRVIQGTHVCACKRADPLQSFRMQIGHGLIPVSHTPPASFLKKTIQAPPVLPFTVFMHESLPASLSLSLSLSVSLSLSLSLCVCQRKRKPRWSLVLHVAPQASPTTNRCAFHPITHNGQQPKPLSDDQLPLLSSAG